MATSGNNFDEYGEEAYGDEYDDEDDEYGE